MPKPGNAGSSSLMAKLNAGTLTPKDLFGETYNPAIIRMVSQRSENKLGLQRFDSLDENQYGKHPGMTKETISLNNIRTIQGILNMDHVKKVISGERKSDYELPFVIKYRNNYYIRDGNHRIAAALIKGKSSMKVNLLDTDKILGE